MRWNTPRAVMAVFLALLVSVTIHAGVVEAVSQPETVILADAADPYYSLATEIAGQENLPIVHSLDEALYREPAFLLWVVSPGRLSDQVLVDFGLAMRERSSSIYNARLQATNMGQDKLVLFEHAGGDFSLHLRSRVPWARSASDLVLDALDGTLLFLQDNGLDTIMVGAGVSALVPVGILLLRRKVSARLLVPAALVGAGLATLHGLYAAAGLEKLAITSKSVEFGFLSPASTFLLAACGAFFFLHAASWRGRAVAVGLTSLGSLAPAAFLLFLLGVVDNLVVRARLGVDLWNSPLGLQALVAFGVEAVLFWIVFSALRRVVQHRPKQSS